VRFLLDHNLSPLLIKLLGEADHDVVHVQSLGLHAATDREILQTALVDDQVVISADTDFGDLLASSNEPGPSVLLLRRQDRRRASEVAALIQLNLDDVSDDLEAGAIVVLGQQRIRVRRLPIGLDGRAG
jgi:predicted nuclease of predicted toxin-antitoxin system